MTTMKVDTDLSLQSLTFQEEITTFLRSYSYTMYICLYLAVIVCYLVQTCDLFICLLSIVIDMSSFYNILINFMSRLETHQH